MNKRITVTLTEDQALFIKNMLFDNVVYAPARQSPERRGFAIRILNELGDPYNGVVDHSSSERLINAKIQSGELKLPKS